MSLEQALEEERREILELLEGRTAPQATARVRRGSSPAPVRSLLDTSPDPAAYMRHGSIAGIGVGVTQSSGHGLSTNSENRPDSGSKDTARVSELADRRSSASATLVQKRNALKNRGVDIHQFSIQPSVPHIVLPKHPGQAGERPSLTW
jgi:hypothetical protein